jgi:D-aminopeptidase
MRPILDSGSVSNIRIPNNTISAGGRNIAFTNNLSIPVCVTGGDPFTNVSISSSATNTVQVSSTDGSFSLVATISGSNGSGQPFALKAVNNGSGGVITTDYSGTLSARAF